MSVRPSVHPLVTIVKKLPLEYQMVTKTYLPSNVYDNSDGSDSSYSSDSNDSNGSCDRSDSSDSGDRSDQNTFFPTKIFSSPFYKNNFFFLFLFLQKIIFLPKKTQKF